MDLRGDLVTFTQNATWVNESIAQYCSFASGPCTAFTVGPRWDCRFMKIAFQIANQHRMQQFYEQKVTAKKSPSLIGTVGEMENGNFENVEMEIKIWEYIPSSL